MLDFSISSVNMAILVSNLFIIFLVLIFRNRKIMFRLGLPLLVGFVILICVRMIFPVASMSIGCPMGAIPGWDKQRHIIGRLCNVE